MTIAEYAERVHAALPEGFRVILDSEGFDFVIDNGIDGPGRIRTGSRLPRDPKFWPEPENVARHEAQKFMEFEQEAAQRQAAVKEQV